MDFARSYTEDNPIVLAKRGAFIRMKSRLLSERFEGSSPAPFVGRFNYPDINVGILAPPGEKDTWRYDAPRYWAQQDLKEEQVVGYRSALINSRFKTNVKKREKLLEISQEIGMASRPVDVEITLDKVPKLSVSFGNQIAPMGPGAQLKQAQITSNPKVDTRVDKVVSDSSLLAADAMNYLNTKGFDENFLTRLLSVGNVGIATNRKLVPTRWSITAVDDTLSKRAVAAIRDYPTTNYEAYFGDYLGNYYLFLMFPEVWSYELFEMYAPKQHSEMFYTGHMTDYEGYAGRKDYASSCQGGYYSVRLAIAEHLRKKKRQATVLALRFVTDEYKVPLGVWVTREAARRAFSKRPIGFASKDLMLRYAQALVKKKFGYDIDRILQKSILIKELKHQKKITSFFS